MRGALSFIVRVLGGDAGAAPVFLGTGVVVAPDRVLSCRHVVVEPEPFGGVSDRVYRTLAVMSAAGVVVPARGAVVDEASDLAVVELAAPLAEVLVPPLLWGLTPALEAQLRASPLVAFGYAAADGVLRRHEVSPLVLLPSYRERAATLAEVQLSGGLPVGCSGGPVLLGWGEGWLYAGTVYLGGEKAATSRVIMADPVAEFLARVGVGDLARVDARRALAGAPVSAEGAAALIERPADPRRRPNPYRGLAAFGEVDAPYFFGREAESEALAAAVPEHRFVLLVGASGSGKSSLLFAGLLPRLRAASWAVAAFRPGRDPFAGVATALAPFLYPELDKLERRARRNDLLARLGEGRLSLTDILAVFAEEHPGQRLLLIADQFEELYTQSLAEERQRRFLDGLTALLEDEGPAHLLLALRADFLSQALAHAPLAAALDKYPNKILAPMTQAQLRAAIEGPAEQLGVRLEPGLAERILEDLGAEPGALPLLEFALTELWERQSEGWLSHGGYDAIGGVSLALAHHADGVAARFRGREDQLRRVFVQLVRPGEGTEDTRQLATREQIGETHWPLVKELADARLVVTTAHEEATNGEQEPAGDGGESQKNKELIETVEVVHEALIRHWQPLRAWIGEDRAFRTWQNRLRQALQDWQASGHDEEALLRGARLAEAEERLRDHHHTLSPAERAYIEESLALREREARARQRRRRLVVGSLSAGLVVAVALMAAAGLFYWRAETFLQEVNAAHSRYLIGLAEEALEDGLTVRAARFSLLAVPEDRHTNDPAVAARARNVLRAVLSLAPSYELGRHKGNAWAIASILDGDQVVSGGDDGKLVLHDGRNPGKQREIGHVDAKVYFLAVAPDRRHLATAGEDGRILFWDVLDSTPARELARHDGEAYAVAISPPGNKVVSGGHDGKILSRDLINRGEPTQVGQHDGDVWVVHFAPDGRRILSAGADGRVMLWNPNNPSASHELDRQPDQMTALAVCPDSSAIVTGGGKGEIYSISFGKQEERVYLGRHIGQVYSLYALSCNNIISAGEDGYIRAWDITKPGYYRTLAKSRNRFVAVRGTPNPNEILAGMDEGGVYLLDTKGFTPIGNRRTLIARHPSRSPIAAIKSAGEGLISSDTDGETLLWKRPYGASLPERLTQKGKTLILGVSQDMECCVIGSEYGNVMLLEKCSNINVEKVGYHEGVWLMSASQNADLVVTVGFDGRMLAWKRDTSEHPRDLGFYDGKIVTISIAFADRIFIGDADGKVARLNYGTEVKIEDIGQHASRIVALAAAPDASSAVAADVDGHIVRWDPERPGTPLELGRQARRITAIGFDPDGRSFATGDEDGVILFWSMVKGAVPLWVGQQDGPVRALVVNDHGNTLITGDANGDIWSWDITTDVLAIARGIKDFGELSETERKLAGLL